MNFLAFKGNESENRKDHRQRMAVAIPDEVAAQIIEEPFFDKTKEEFRTFGGMMTNPMCRVSLEKETILATAG